MIFSWVYEMTPEGLRREVYIDRSQSITPETGKKINTLIIVLLVLAIAGLVADRLIPESSVDTDIAAVETAEAPLPADDRSIAVLPFSDLSQDRVAAEVLKVREMENSGQLARAPEELPNILSL